MNNIRIRIGGVDCRIMRAERELIICDTGSRPTSISTQVEVFVEGKGNAIEVSINSECEVSV